MSKCYWKLNVITVFKFMLNNLILYFTLAVNAAFEIRTLFRYLNPIICLYKLDFKLEDCKYNTFSVISI